MPQILIIDDNEQIRRAIEKFLVKLGHSAHTARNGEEGLNVLRDNTIELVLTDLKMPVMTGIEFLESLKAEGLDVPVILLTGHGNVDSAVKAMKLGAADYLSKPLQFDELAVRIDRLLEKKALKAENSRLRSALKSRNNYKRIVGKSSQMRRLFETMGPLASDGNISVFIYGETGTGKELVAKSLHYSGPRSDKPFVAINCGALPEQLLESELFGHEEGAFTDARATKIGLFETANGGTLFLDEIDSMPPGVQVKLLRAIEEKTIRRVGGTSDIPLNIRIVCAANSRLDELSESGRFRSDLYFRLAVATLELPPLRTRNGDVFLLADHFAGKKRQGGNNRITFSGQVKDLFASHLWPGNVRELENLVELLSVTNPGNEIQLEDLPPNALKPKQNPTIESRFENSSDLKSATRDLVEDFEKRFILDKLNSNQWNVSKTAAMIGLSRAALHTKIKQYGLRQ